MRPAWHDDHALLAAVARHLHAQRAAHYPRLVADGRISRAKALDGLRVMRTIARRWRALAQLDPEPFGVDARETGGAPRCERIEHLTIAARHARAHANAAPAELDKVHFAEAVEALLWWERRCPSARFHVDLTLELRARAAASRQSLEKKAA